MDMETLQSENRAELRGTVAAGPAFSHENHGAEYWTFPLAVRRLSGSEDVLNVIVSAAVLERCPVKAGDEVEVRGEVRSFNNKGGVGSRLVITLYAKSLERAEGEHRNELVLAGALCKMPVLRRTPLGREICDLMLAVNRRYGRADYLPCIAWGAVAQQCADLAVGAPLRLEGRLQSRVYTKLVDGLPQERVAYEVSVMRLLEREEAL